MLGLITLLLHVSTAWYCDSYAANIARTCDRYGSGSDSSALLFDIKYHDQITICDPYGGVQVVPFTYPLSDGDVAYGVVLGCQDSWGTLNYYAPSLGINPHGTWPSGCTSNQFVGFPGGCNCAVGFLCWAGYAACSATGNSACKGGSPDCLGGKATAIPTCGPNTGSSFPSAYQTFPVSVFQYFGGAGKRSEMEIFVVQNSSQFRAFGGNLERDNEDVDLTPIIAVPDAAPWNESPFVPLPDEPSPPVIPPGPQGPLPPLDPIAQPVSPPVPCEPQRRIVEDNEEGASPCQQQNQGA